jgi:nucleoside-diphosphate-sugar epimerase
VKLLVMGGSGYVGRHVCRSALAAGATVIGTYHSKPLDLVARRRGLDPAALPSASCAGLGRPGHVVMDIGLARSLLRTRLRGIREILG